MRTHQTVYVIAVLSKRIQQAGCKSTLSEVVMDNELGDPAYGFTLAAPTTGKSISCKAIVGSDLHIRAAHVVG